MLVWHSFQVMTERSDRCWMVRLPIMTFVKRPRLLLVQWLSRSILSCCHW